MGDARRDHSIREGLAGRDAQAPAVDEGAVAILGRVELVENGIVDDAADHLPLPLQPYGDAEERDAVQEVGGAVERIDDPAMRLVRTRNEAPLLHQEAVARPGSRQLLEDG